mgnify:CR=1 FL=1
MAKSKKASPRCSIIIRTFNEEKHLARLFDAIDTQTEKDIETIVVDSGSYDRTRSIAEPRADKLQSINSYDFTFGYSLNVGIKAAKGEFAVMVSAHTIPKDDDWLEKLLAPFEDKNVAMTYGRHLGVASSKFSEVEDFDRIFGPEPRIEHPSRFAANNANSAVRRALWEEYPFDESLTGLEDIDWAKHWMGLGRTVVYRPEAALYHVHEETWQQVTNRYFREAVAWARMGLKSRKDIPRFIFEEARNTFVDIVRAYQANDNPVCERLTLGQRLREIIYYRSCRLAGTLKGLTMVHPLEQQSERESVMFNRVTQAVVVRGPRRAAIEKITLPQLRPGEILIRVANVAMCATDLEVWNGTLGYYKSGMAKYPIVPGHEFSGRVSAIGHNVSNFKEGDPVVVECIQSCGVCNDCRAGNYIGCNERSEVGVLNRNGAYAEYVISPARFVHKLPASMDLKRAALVEPAAVIIKGLRRLNSTIGSNAPGKKRAAVVGAGPLGQMCARLMMLEGYEVTAFDRNPERLALLKNAGIACGTDHQQLADFPVVVEVTGDPKGLDRVLHLTPANCRILLLGLPYGLAQFSFETIAAFDKTVVGSIGSTGEDFERAIAVLDKLDLEPYFENIVPLKNFEAAWIKYENAGAFKIIFDLEQA